MESIIESVSPVSTRPVSNTVSRVNDPLEIFKRDNHSSSILSLDITAGIIGILATLFSDNIISKLEEFVDIVTPVTSLLSIPEGTITGISEGITETISENTLEFIKTSFESATPNITTLAKLSVPSVLSTLISGLDGVKDSQVSKISSIQERLSQATLTLFGPLITPDNFFKKLVSGEFVISVVSKVADMIRSIGKSVVLSGIHAGKTVMNLNSKWVPSESEHSSKIQTISAGTSPIHSGDQDVRYSKETNPQLSATSDTHHEDTGSSPSGPIEVSGNNSWVTAPLTESEVTSATIHSVNTKSGIRWTSPKQWLRGIIAIESAGKANAANKYGYQGLFQLYKGYSIFQRGNRFNANDNHRMAKAFWISDCIPALKRKGVPISPISLYMTHQQGPSGGSTIMRNWMNRRNVVSGKASSRTLNGGVMGDVDFTNHWIRGMASREATLRSLTGSGGYDTVLGISEHDERYHEFYPTVYVDKIPDEFSSDTGKGSLKLSSNYLDTASSIGTTVESIACSMVPPRLNSPSIINMTLSTRML